MIRSFRSKVLAELWNDGRSARLDERFVKRILRRLQALNDAASPSDMNIPGFDFHALKNQNPKRYTVHVNGPWCITFEFIKGDAVTVDFEQYH